MENNIPDKPSNFIPREDPVEIKLRKNVCNHAKESILLTKVDSLSKHSKKIAINAIIISLFMIIEYFVITHAIPSMSLGSIIDPLSIYQDGNGSVNGRVYDSFGAPISNITVIAADTGGLGNTTFTLTDVHGKFILSHLHPSQYSIIALFPSGNLGVKYNIKVDSNSLQTIVFIT